MPSVRVVVLLLTTFTMAMAIGCGDGTAPRDEDPSDPPPEDLSENRIAFISDGQVATMREDGSNQAVLTHETFEYEGRSADLEWSPDGTQILNVVPGLVGNSIIAIPAGGGRPRDLAFSGYGLAMGKWSPNGSQIAYTVATESHWMSSAIAVIGANGKGGMEVSTGWLMWDNSPAWSPDGQEIAFLSNRPTPTSDCCERHVFIVQAAGSEERQLYPGAVIGFAWGPDGRFAVLEDREAYPYGNIVVVSRDGGTRTRLSQPDKVDGYPVWSPDGTRLAFTSIRDGNPEIYVMNDDGSEVKRLTNNLDRDQYPTWSPDGTRLAFESNVTDDWEIYSIRVDGTELTNLTQRAGDQTNPTWR